MKAYFPWYNGYCNPYSEYFDKWFIEDFGKNRLWQKTLISRRKKFIKKAVLQESYLADAQHHYFRGEFEQSLQSLDEMNLKKSRWRRRKVLLTGLSYYRILNKINQKDFADFEDSLALYRKMKGKNVPERSAKLLAIYRVVSGQSTDYFERIAPKYKLYQIEAKYYDGLSYLNQNQPEEAKACFQEIVNENPELFYVKEAKKYLEELAW